MRIVLIGTVESTSVTLRSMIEGGHPPVALIGLDASLAGRHSDFVDMQALAEQADIPFIPVRSVNAPEIVDRISKLEPDWLVVVGWSQICHPPLLSTPKFGAIGYHPSPLPELRGRAVLAWTILLDRDSTGGSLFALEPTVDSGEILAQALFSVEPRETLPSLLEKHMQALAGMWRDLLPRMVEGHVEGRSQDESRVSFCAKRTVADGRINWTESAVELDRLIRAVTAPYPGAFSVRGDDTLIVWEAEPWTGPIYYGRPGQILAVDEDQVLIACRRGETLAIRHWTWATGTDARPLRVADQLQ